MAELAAARIEVEAAVEVDAARATAVELKALRASSTGSSVSADDDRDNALNLAREAAWEQVVLWAGANATAVSLTVAAAQIGTDAPTAGLTEITVFTGGAALLPRIGTMVIMGSRPLSGTSVPAAGDLPSPRPTTSSGPR
jgi:hypothetical protein